MKCALCGRNAPLARSHIVPEFLHKAAYDANHRTLLVKHRAPQSRVVQKGKTERLLCLDCERLIGRHEKWFADFWYQSQPVPARVDGPIVELTGLDYSSFKLFMLSVAWRASVSSLPEFEQADLGPHESTIGRMLLANDPGEPREYPIIGVLLVEPEARAAWDNVLLLPMKTKIDGRWACRMVFGGAAWTVITSSHSTATFEAFELKSSGTITMLTQSVGAFAVDSGLSEVVHGARATLSS